jgi:hypothetical protein
MGILRATIRWVLASTVVLLMPALASAQAKNVCVNCHAKLEGSLKVTAEQADVHGHKGMSCDVCHGGNTQDEARAKAAGSGFRGHISREQIPQLCGSCHADVNYIKRFNPSLRTDQMAQYHTSVHGIQFAKGDTHVAICTDCHGVHDIRPASDPRSPVHPLNVAQTCQRCHSDATLMKSYRILATQFADYTDSVHHQAMFERRDPSAPTCSTCHGSHGAVPPGGGSVANVCSTCHVLQAQFFDESPHKAVFAEGCATCHTSHKIKHPDDNFVGLAAGSACGECHTADDESGKAANAIHDRLHKFEVQVADARVLLAKAEQSGMDVAEAQTVLGQANDALTKARVRVHTALLARVNTELEAGSKPLAAAHSAGEAAMKERTFRRRVILVPGIAILAVVFALGFYIRELERSEAEDRESTEQSDRKLAA